MGIERSCRDPEQRSTRQSIYERSGTVVAYISFCCIFLFQLFKTKNVYQVTIIICHLLRKNNYILFVHDHEDDESKLIISIQMCEIIYAC